MYKVFRVMKKEFLQLRRDRRIFPILFVAPVLQLVFMGYAATLDIKHIPIITWDQDRTRSSREIIRSVTASLYFDRSGKAQNYSGIGKALRTRKAKVALIIPAGYQEKLKQGEQAAVQAIIDGTDSNQAILAQNYLSIIIQMENATVLTHKLNSVAAAASSRAPHLAARLSRLRKTEGLAVRPEPRVWYNPELRSANFMVPGVVVMVLLVITTMLTSLAVVREKEVGTMEQVIVTPIESWQFILGKLAPFIIIGFIEVTIVVIIAILWFQVPFKGSMAALYGYAALFLLTTLGLGMFISSISGNQQQAMMSAFFIMFAMVLLSGFMFPIENMPEPVQWLTLAIPMRYFLVIVRSLFLKGSEFGVLWEQAAGLLVIGLSVIGLSISRFRKTLD